MTERERFPEGKYKESVLYTPVQTHGAGNSQRERDGERERVRGRRENNRTVSCRVGRRGEEIRRFLNSSDFWGGVSHHPEP